jgi:hypothetical protein
MRGKRKRLSKKEWKRLERERAEEEAKVRSDSLKRQERIKELWNLITSGKLSSRGDESENFARDLKSEIEEDVFAEWTTVKKGESEKGLRRRDREDTHQRRSSNELYLSLVELIDLQRNEIEYMRPDHALCEWAKTHAPNELAALREKHPFMLVLRAVVARATKLTPKQASEWRTRSGQRRQEVGLIEYEFGGLAEARAGFPYDPSCLDDILMGYGVTMEYLEILFEMERHRFPKKLQSVRLGRKKLYSALQVVKIMDALLKEKLLERKRRSRGGSLKKVWLSNPDRRKRVLTGIAYRAMALSRNKVLAAFMAVVCRHLAIGYPKEQLPEGFEDWLARLGRRYLD